MKKVLLHSLALLSMLGIFSCNSDLEGIPYKDQVKEDLVVKDGTTYSPQLLAKELAVIVQNEEVRDFIKDEALKQKDGDFDILFTEIIDKEISNVGLRSFEGTKNTLRNLLSQRLETKSNNNSIGNLLSDIQENYPLLQIAIPNMETASWENIVSRNVPFLVAFLDEDYDDMSGESIMAYDQDGNEHILDGKVAPKEPVIVISESERVFSVPVSELNEYSDYEEIYRTDECVYLKKNFVSLDNTDVNDYKEDLRNTDMTSLRASSSYRETHPTYRDYIWKAQLPTDENYESWAKGRPEISVKVVFWENKLPIKEIRYDDKGWANHNIRIFNSEIVTWDPTLLGYYIAYSWREEDGGNEDKKVQITFPSQTIKDVVFPSISFSINVCNKDDVIGTSYVYYKEENEKRYDPTGENKFYFWMQVRS